MSQAKWDKALRWAAKHGYTLADAVTFYRHLAMTLAFPTEVKPLPVNDPSILRTKVAALYPEMTRQTWGGK